jgi:hypothetical protein
VRCHKQTEKCDRNDPPKSDRKDHERDKMMVVLEIFEPEQSSDRYGKYYR